MIDSRLSTVFCSNTEIGLELGCKSLVFNCFLLSSLIGQTVSGDNKSGPYGKIEEEAQTLYHHHHHLDTGEGGSPDGKSCRGTMTSAASLDGWKFPFSFPLYRNERVMRRECSCRSLAMH